MHPTSTRSTTSIVALVAAIGILVLAVSACDETAPDRLLTNLRETTFQVTSRIPTGEVTLEGPLDRISVEIGVLPVLAEPTQTVDGFAYEGWISYPDTGSSRIYISTGRFRIDDADGIDPIHRCGDVRFTYERGGGFQVTSGGNALGQGQALPDSVELTEGVNFILAIEPDPDSQPGAPGAIHPLVTDGDLPSTAGEVGLIVPVNIGLENAGDFSPLEGEVWLSATTGEFKVTLEDLPFLDRSSPPGDPGLIYQAWFVDDDVSPPRYRNLGRFRPTAVGDATLGSPNDPPIETADSDQDGVPEPLDFERVLISIEPDGLNAQQPIEQGLDTSGEIFPLVPYRARLP